jgi:hypothetical protein
MPGPHDTRYHGPFPLILKLRSSLLSEASSGLKPICAHAAGQSGEAAAFMPGLKLARHAAGEQGAAAFQCRRRCPLTEHRSIGVPELPAVELAPLAQAVFLAGQGDRDPITACAEGQLALRQGGLGVASGQFCHWYARLTDLWNVAFLPQRSKAEAQIGPTAMSAGDMP